MSSIKSIRTFVFLTIIIFSTNKTGAQSTDPPFLKYLNHPWVDSVMNSLTSEEKIAQLIWVAAFSNGDLSHEIYLSDLIKKTGIGGIIFFQGNAPEQSEMITYYQKISKVPLMVVTDGEWGIGMRLNDVTKFPYQMTLGAIKNDSLIYQMGKSVAAQFRRAGIQINLAPDADVINNPLNPVINFRSFGENPEIVSHKSLMYMNGLQDNGIITLAKNMTGIIEYPSAGESEINEQKAWINIPEYVTEPERAIYTIKEQIRLGEITKESVNEKCRKVLAAKYWAGLNKPVFVDANNILRDLNPPSDDALIRELYASALTVLNNDQNILPLRDPEKIKIATVAVNRNSVSSFQTRIANYFPADQYFIDPSDSVACNNLLKKLSEYDLVIAGIFDLDQRPDQEFGITPGLVGFLGNMVSNNKTIITWFGNPYAIDKIESLRKVNGLILAYQENTYTEDLSAQLIFGGIGARGTLPVTINNQWPADYGIMTTGNIRLQYGIPESAGISSVLLNSKIDSIVNAGIAAKAYPGCLVMAARKGVVVFQKAYGFQTYENRMTLKEDDLFDLASVTKISSTLAGLMLLNSEGKFTPDETLGFYLPDFKRTNKGNILMRDFLTHQAGLTPFIPFWRETIKKNGNFRHNTFDYHYSKKFPIEVAQGLYINKNYKTKMFREIKKSSLGEKKYLYSDLTFIIAPQIIEKLTGQKWYDFVTDSIYKKIGAMETGFNPYIKYPLSRIVPTEFDSLFRKMLLHGTVHDEGAAMLGGISGHAGLFSTANDLMKLMELYRRMGDYGGQQLISRNVMEEYTRIQFPENDNRRGLGFDKPLLNNSGLSQKDSYPTRSASSSSFGHSGYTGTFVWVDPVFEITYIFLSNRVYPTRRNEELYKLNIRKEILQAIYESIIK